MTSIYPVMTEDGTFSLFNSEINDIYHSKIGAYTEALNKFVIPSGILDFAKYNNEISILDVCFGLGYNSKVAISAVWKINPDCKINVTVLENDIDVLALSCISDFPGINLTCKQAFIEAISKLADIKSVIKKYNLDVNLYSPFKEDLNLNASDLSSNPAFDQNLHNIYYQPISDRIKNTCYAGYNSHLINISIFIDDARNIIRGLKPYYNYIFHDPFTPSKLPTLWTVDFFKELYRLLDLNGSLTTYTSSAAVRSGFIDAGFFVGTTNPIGRKSSGTFACRNKDLITTQLTEYDKGLLETNAGVPYFDPDLDFGIDEINEYRLNIQRNSRRISSSKYIKEHSHLLDKN